MPELPSCSVVIRSHNEERHIGRLLSGILRQTLSIVDVVVVDSGSSDATLAIATRYPVRTVSIRPEEFSFGRSLNAGFRAARGEIIVVASAHVYPVYEDWLERLMALFVDPTLALAYGKQRGDHRTRFSEGRVFARWFPDGPGGPQDHPFCNNANAAVRRSVWEEAPYDEELTGLEDIAWAKDAMRRGYSVAYVPEAEVVHVHDETPRQIFNRYRREAIAMKRISPGEGFSFLDFVWLWASNTVSDVVHAASQRRLRSNLLDIVVFRSMQFWGTYRGFALQGPVDTALKRKFYFPNEWRTLTAPEPRAVREIDYSHLE